MATAVLDLDLASPLDVVPFPDRYDAAHVVVRFRGRPVGAAVLPAAVVRGGGPILLEALERAGGDPLRRARALEWIGWEPLRPLDRPAGPASICVPTRNRPDDLARCLAAIRRMPDDGQEVLVVDSASDGDASEKVARGFPGVRYFREERPGLDRARNRGLREARMPIVAFTDDDAMPEPFWLRALERAFDDRLVLAATGLTLPL
ncbi:MAG: glycosyltransferase family 2 protein, partial [Candidatus Latescibacterota bacterium]